MLSHPPSEMEETEIRELVALLETSPTHEAELIWEKLKPLGPDLLPYFIEYYPKMRKWKGRVSLIFYSIQWARDHEKAFELGITALKDKATLVRYRACMLLAYSLKKEAVPHLKILLTHKDTETVKDAEAAIYAIQSQNHHYFIDRSHSGKSFWRVNKDDKVKKKPWWRFW